MQETFSTTFIIFGVLMIFGFACMIYQHTYLTDPKIRNTKEYKKAVEKHPDTFPETGAYLDIATAIVTTHLTWLLIKKSSKTKADKRFIFYTFLSFILALLFLTNMIYTVNKFNNLTNKSTPTSQTQGLLKQAPR